MIRVYMPWNNLGCLGIRIGSLYADLYRRPYSRRLPWIPGLFIAYKGTRRWISVNGIKHN